MDYVQKTNLTKKEKEQEFTLKGPSEDECEVLSRVCSEEIFQEELTRGGGITQDTNRDRDVNITLEYKSERS